MPCTQTMLPLRAPCDAKTTIYTKAHEKTSSFVTAPLAITKRKLNDGAGQVSAPEPDAKKTRFNSQVIDITINELLSKFDDSYAHKDLTDTVAGGSNDSSIAQLLASFPLPNSAVPSIAPVCSASLNKSQPSAAVVIEASIFVNNDVNPRSIIPCKRKFEDDKHPLVLKRIGKKTPGDNFALPKQQRRYRKADELHPKRLSKKARSVLKVEFVPPVPALPPPQTATAIVIPIEAALTSIDEEDDTQVEDADTSFCASITPTAPGPLRRSPSTFDLQYGMGRTMSVPGLSQRQRFPPRSSAVSDHFSPRALVHVPEHVKVAKQLKRRALVLKCHGDIKYRNLCDNRRNDIVEEEPFSPWL